MNFLGARVIGEHDGSQLPDIASRPLDFSEISSPFGCMIRPLGTRGETCHADRAEPTPPPDQHCNGKRHRLRGIKCCWLLWRNKIDCRGATAGSYKHSLG